MKALTIWQPWAACIAHGPKRVENRTWAPSDWPFELAVHAAAMKLSSSEVAAGWACEELWPSIVDAPLDRGCIVAVADVVGIYRVDPDVADMFTPAPAADPWAVGPVCWQLDNVRALAEPVPCRGMQGLWTLPPGVEVRVLASAHRHTGSAPNRSTNSALDSGGSSGT